MKNLILAPLLSLLGPGLGQIYNKDFKKGIALLVVTTAMIVVPTFWLMKQVMPQISLGDKESMAQERVQGLMLETVQKHKRPLNVLSFLFLGLWAYSITDSYFRARELEGPEAADEDDDEKSDDDQ